jgi:multicomponent Na+:H+ antiporter subunit B
MANPAQPYNLVLRVAAKMLIPLIMMFALYVQFHGETGPGGGFQAGVIFAAAFILYALVFGMETARTVVPPAILRVLAGSGVLLYAGVGLASLLAGGNFLDYSVLAEAPLEGQHLGIFLIELGVGITVASVMIIIFFAFAERGVRR